MNAFIAIATMICITICLLVVSPRIHAWEKANDYPFGKLCDLYNNCAR